MKTTFLSTSGAVLLLAAILPASAQLNTNATSGRLIRGTSPYPDTHSFVITLDFQKGIPLADMGNNTNLFGGIVPWFALTARGGQTNEHLDYQYTLDQNDGYIYYFDFQNPIAAFGGAVGGSPLYTNDTYRFGVHFGAQFEGTGPDDAIYAAPIRILVYPRSAFLPGTNKVAALATNLISIPRRTIAADSNAWVAFVTNNLSKVHESHGLRTEVRLIDGPTVDDAWGAQVFGFNVQNNVFLLSHTALPDSTNYYYLVEGVGEWLEDAASYPLVYNYDFSAQGWDPLYAVNFDTRPPGRVRFLDQPHFAGAPLPPDYLGKSAEEWENYTASLTNLPSLSNSTNYTGLDNSPELRRHPILDRFVNDLRNDPIALASYVVNEVAVTDPIGLGDVSQFPMDSVNLAGVNRSALGTFLEKQGSPVEQCALLVYLLRQAGYPAAYVWPTNNNLKILDTVLSKLMRAQVRGAVDTYGDTFTTNALITVNYPWVAARLPDGSTVHVFPWLKDTEVIEGLSLPAYLPTNYNRAYKWVTDYVYGKSSVLGWSTETDAPLDLFKKFVTGHLLTNYPGLSLDDFGVQFRDRQTRHSRWTDFGKPNQIDNQSQVAIVQDLTRITNIHASWSNIFDTVQIQVQRASTTIIDSGPMRASDLHTRKFLLYSNANNLTLWLASYRTNITGQSSFSNDPGLTNKQVAAAAFQGGDSQFNVRFIYKRHRQLNPTNAVSFLGVGESLALTNDRPFYKGETAAILFNAGQVTREMVRVQAEDFWRAERRKQTNSAYAPTVDEYQGVAATVMGLSYFEQTSRSLHDLEQLYKLRNFSVINFGLAKFNQKLVTNVVKTLPIVDMQGLVVTTVGNSSLHQDSGDDLRNAYEDLAWQQTAQGSALEHRLINGFFLETNAISTVKLLQIAQAKANAGTSGIVQLYKMNYVSVGNSASAGYGATLLKNYDPALWTKITNAFADWDGDYVRVFITPAPQTNQGASYRGMAALIYGKDTASASIQPNLNGGWGSYEPDFNYSSGVNYLDYSLGTGPDDSLYFNYNSGAGFHTFDSISVYDTANFFGTGSSLYATPYQQDTTYQVGLQYNLNNPTFSGSYFTAGDSGYFGNPDWLPSVGYQVSDPVNPLTGEFYIDAVDLTLPGPFPLQVRRNYLSQNRSQNQFGVGWKWALTPFLVLTNSTQGAVNQLIYATEMDGSVVAYRYTNGVWKPQVSDNPSLNNNNTYGIGSTANMLNARIERVITNSLDVYTLFGPDGSARRYELRSYPISSGTNLLDRTRPYLVQWRDHATNTLAFLYGQDNTAVDYGQVVRVESTNGNYLAFDYDSYGRIVEAFAGDGRRLFYEYDRYGDLVTVTLPDASEISYEYGRYTYTNNGVRLDSNHLITRELKPDGRQLVNQYDSQRRVTNQLATVGADLNPVRNATFIYSNNFNPTNLAPLAGYTRIQDVFGHTNRYDYTNGCIAKITDPLSQTIEQVWYADNATAPGYPRSLQLRKDKRGLWTEFKYDGRGNVTNMLQFTTAGIDNLTGDSASDASTTNATWTALYTTNNLLQEATDPASNTVRYTYDSMFTWLPAQIVKLTQGTPVSTNTITYGIVTDSVTNGSLIITRTARGLRQREVRGSVATNEWAYDGRGFVTQQTRYARTAADASNPDPPVITTLFHNDRGELVQRIDADGRSTSHDFDGLGRPKGTEVFDEYGTALARSYTYYNYNGELVWSDGPQSSPEDYVWRDYDGGGRKIVEIAWRSEATADGSDIQAGQGDNLYATSFFEYDSFGNLTKTTDPRGNYSVRRWDALGRLTQQEWYGANNTAYATNYFSYEPGGLVRYTTNALGAYAETRYTATGQPRYRLNADGSTQSWTYYQDGRLKCEYLVNGSHWTNIYQDTLRKLTRYFKKGDGTILATNSTEFDARGNVVKTTDNEGKVWTTTFDGLDRPKTVAGPEMVTISEDCGQTPGCGVYVTNVAQRVTAYLYDASGQVTTVSNRLGEKTVTYLDALGRTYRVDIMDTNANYIHTRDITYYTYGHAADYWEGTGDTALLRRDYLDHAGRTVLTYRWPDNSSGEEYSRAIQRFDRAGNRTDTEESGRFYAGGGSYVEQTFATNHWTFDGLNRVATESVRDGATTTNYYDANHSVTNRFLPGGLKQVATYTADGRLTQQYVIGSGSDRMNELTFTYYGSGATFAGKLYTTSDGRGVARTNSYDDWCRLKTVSTGGSSAQHVTTTTYDYNRRSLLTQVAQSFATNATGPGTTITRSYDSYGFLSSESVKVGDTTLYTATTGFDIGGRRTLLNLSSLGALGFGSRADGLLTSVSGPGYTASYTYQDNGLLASRSDGTKTVIYARDDLGRLTYSTNKFGASTKLTETFIWWPDTRLSTYVAGRSDFTDTRYYDYAAWSRYLTNEQYYLTNGVTDTQDYHFDYDAAKGLGVLTGSADWDAASSGGLDSLKRPLKGTTTYARVPAFGAARGAATVTATLNGQPVPVEFAQGGSNGWFYAQLLPQSGANTLKVTAIHTSGMFTNSATNYFTNTITSHTVTNQYDAFGNISRRVWRKANGGLVRQQDFTWDAFNRLVKVSERDANTNGFEWAAVFDAFGRRLRVSEQHVLTNIYSGSVSVTESYYDPSVEFLEVGVNYIGRKELKIFGPDVSGIYGGAQGIGGLEAVIDASGTNSNTVLNDRYGNVLGYAPVGQASGFQWAAARFTSYGPKVGYETPFLASPTPLVQSLGWQGQRRDVTGLYYWNARPYDPVERRFLSPDPAGISSFAPYNYGNGDGVNWFDPSGRDAAYSMMFANLNARQTVDAARIAAPLTAAMAVGMLTGGAADAALVGGGFLAQGSLTAAALSGTAAGLGGDLAYQGTRLMTGDQTSFSWGQLGLSGAIGGGLGYGFGVAGNYLASFRQPLQNQVMEAATSPQFIARAEAQGFTTEQISQLPARIGAYGENLTHGVTGGYADATSLQIGRLNLLSSRDAAISHELGHVLDDVASGAFTRATEPGFGFSGFYQAESIAYRMQYGFNPAPLTAFNALGQAYPTATRIAVWGTGAAVAGGYAYSFRDELSSLFSSGRSPASDGAILGRKP